MQTLIILDGYLSLIRSFSPVVLVVACSLLLSASLAGQDGRLPWHEYSEPGASLQRIVVYGDITSGESSFGSGTIRLIPISTGEATKAATRWNGSFEFRGVAPGVYSLRVSDARGTVLHEEMVSLYRNGETLSIRLRAADSAQKGQAQTVSMQELQHKSPRKALKAHKSARAFMKKKQFALAVDRLKSALAADPEFVAAHNDLGAAYFLLEDYRRSAEHFQKAIDLVPTHKKATENLCIALIKLGRLTEAGQAATRIVSRGGGSPILHYAMAASLVVRGSPNEALFHLRRADNDLPAARLLAARLLADTGQRAEAAREVEAYLRCRDGDARRPELEAWLAELRR